LEILIYSFCYLFLMFRSFANGYLIFLIRIEIYLEAV
ncbi:MAG: hypothetical protein ACI8YI_002563, partial [Paracoccaceae bacterium]